MSLPRSLLKSLCVQHLSSLAGSKFKALWSVWIILGTVWPIASWYLCCMWELFFIQPHRILPCACPETQRDTYEDVWSSFSVESPPFFYTVLQRPHFPQTLISIPTTRRYDLVLFGILLPALQSGICLLEVGWGILYPPYLFPFSQGPESWTSCTPISDMTVSCSLSNFLFV